MDQELRAILTAPRIGCTQEHIAAFEKEGILKASDVRLLTDPDFSAMHIGIATKNRVMAAMQQHAAGVGSEALQRAPPVQTHIGDFIYSPPVAAAAAATHSSTRPAASSKASRDGQRGGKQKAANVNTAKQLAGTMNVFLSGGRKKTATTVTAAATTTASKACSEKAKVPVDMPTMETVESDPSSEDETEASSSTRPIVRPKAPCSRTQPAARSRIQPAPHTVQMQPAPRSPCRMTMMSAGLWTSWFSTPARPPLRRQPRPLLRRRPLRRRPRHHRQPHRRRPPPPLCRPRLPLLPPSLRDWARSSTSSYERLSDSLQRQGRRLSATQQAARPSPPPFANSTLNTRVKW